ncbi:MAG: XdhC family protein, partial [Ignavibacteriae bacterium]|nr:XdhC family protein [Ignavibacteriota bacterium]
MNSESFWQFLEDKLKSKRRLLLTIVIEASGSSPGRQGFKMAVASDGKIAGTVGGGIMENNIINESKALLKKKPLPVYYKG